jgi:hypothetical protein
VCVLGGGVVEAGFCVCVGVRIIANIKKFLVRFMIVMSLGTIL